MKFAIDRETDLKDILVRAIADPKLSSLADQLTAMTAQNQSNLKLLERTRREGICEMVLHPITGLNSDDYVFAADPHALGSADGFVSFIKIASEKLMRFYATAGEKLPADDAKRAFLKLAKKPYL